MSICDPPRITWDKITLRMKDAARATTGAAILTVRVVLVEGQPRFIARPRVDHIEPRADSERFIDMLANDDYGANTLISPP